MRASLLLPLALMLASRAPALAKPKRAAHPVEPAGPPVPAADISGIKDTLKLLTDGKSHYIAVVPFGAGKELFYGDGKAFYAQRVFSSGSVGKESFDYAFWEPRVSAPYKGSFELRDGKFRVRCDERLTEVTPVPESESQSSADICSRGSNPSRVSKKPVTELTSTWCRCLVWPVSANLTGRVRYSCGSDRSSSASTRATSPASTNTFSRSPQS